MIYPKPEILAPAGSEELAYLAAESGADAVYFGLQKFSARRAAVNVAPERLATVITKLHRQGVKAYLTLNTIVQECELREIEELLALCLEAEADSVIIQDLFLLDLLRQRHPDILAHASTQMNIHSSRDLRTAARLGFQRVVLPRETSREQLLAWLPITRQEQLETEFFVHGALCMAVSGRCQISFMQGGRSANRGACAQACRLAWQLATTADRTNGGTNKAQSSRILRQGALLSPKDQSLLSQVPFFSREGVTSLKIEGRMKGEAYLRAVVGSYRQAADLVAAGTDDETFAAFVEAAEAEMAQAFNRGGSFTQRAFFQTSGIDFTSGDFVGNYGVEIAVLTSVNAQKGLLRMAPVSSAVTIAKGDVLTVRRGVSELAAAPVGRVSERREKQQNILEISGFHPQKLRSMRRGDRIFRVKANRTPKNGSQPVRQSVPLDWRIEVRSEEPLLWVRATGIWREHRLSAEQGFTRAELQPIDSLLSAERWGEQLRRTDQTIFTFNSLTLSDNTQAELERQRLGLRVSSVNRIRRELLAYLSDQLVEMMAHARQVAAQRTYARISPLPEKSVSGRQLPTQLLSLLHASQMEQLDADDLAAVGYLEIPLATLELDVNWFVQLKRIRQMGSRPAILLRLPEIMQAKQETRLREIFQQNDGRPDGISLSHLSGLDPTLYQDLLPDKRELEETQSAGRQCVLLHSNEQANVINSRAADYYLAADSVGFSPSPEWASDELNSWLDTLSDEEAARVFVSSEYRMPVMYLNYCPLGQNQPDCRICRFDRDKSGLPGLYCLRDANRAKSAEEGREMADHLIITDPRFCHSLIARTDLINPYASLSPDNQARVSRRRSCNKGINFR